MQSERQCCCEVHALHGGTRLRRRQLGMLRACLGSRPMRVLNRPVPRMMGNPKPTTRSSQLRPNKLQGRGLKRMPCTCAVLMHAPQQRLACRADAAHSMRASHQVCVEGLRACTPLHLGQPGGLVRPVGGEQVILPKRQHGHQRRASLYCNPHEALRMG